MATDFCWFSASVYWVRVSFAGWQRTTRSAIAAQANQADQLIIVNRRPGR